MTTQEAALPPDTKWRCALAAFFAMVVYQIHDVNQGQARAAIADGDVNLDVRNFATIENLQKYAIEAAVQIVFGIIFTILHVACRRFFFPISDFLIKRKPAWSVAVRNARRERWCASIFKLTYFVLISGFGWVILREQEWTPPSLGGKGSLLNLYSGQTVPDSVNWYYRIASGYHISELIFQCVFEWNRPDFYSMVLHHIVTVWLLFFSMVASYHRHGTLVLLIHDISDIPAYMCKFTVDITVHVSAVLTSYVLTLLTWGYLRLYVFVTIIWTIPQIAGYHDVPGWRLFFVLLSCLVALHCFWYMKFIQMGLRFAGSGVAEDSVANLEEMEKRERRSAAGKEKRKDGSVVRKKKAGVTKVATEERS